MVYDDGRCSRANRLANFFARFIPTFGRDQGHSAMQIAQPELSAKYGIHLSKSTYQRSTPRIIVLIGSIAIGGHASSQIRQLEQNLSIPNSLLGVFANGASVRTADILEALYPLLIRHGTPQYIRSDNGPEFTAEVFQKWLTNIGIKPIRIYPGSPWE